jgi:hypothetical protein
MDDANLTVPIAKTAACFGYHARRLVSGLCAVIFALQGSNDTVGPHQLPPGRVQPVAAFHPKVDLSNLADAIFGIDKPPLFLFIHLFIHQLIIYHIYLIHALDT